MFDMRPARAGDAAVIREIDARITPRALREHLRARTAYVLFWDGRPVGVLRYGMLWDALPYLRLLYILEPYRRRGIGALAMARWEADMRALGYAMALLSTQADEDAQHFYRRLGYIDCGVLVLDNCPLAQPLEIFMRKTL